METVNLELCIVRHPDLVSTDMDGDTVMMSIERGEYFGIGGVGTRVWELLESPHTVRELVARICAEYEVDEATCAGDLLPFVDQLLANEAVRIA